MGSFYDFFGSKEELYIEVIAEEVPAGVQRIIDASFAVTDNTRHALIRLMKAATDEMERNPLASVLLDRPQELLAILSAVDYAKLMTRIGGAYDPLIACIRERQDRGEIVGGDAYGIWYCMGMVKFLPVNRRNFPPTVYESLQTQFPEVIANGLTRTKSNAKEE